MATNTLPWHQRPTTTAQVHEGHRPAAGFALAGLRLAMAGIFLWAFFDKLLGLGFSTPAARAWLAGGSPTRGFLSGAEGPFAGFYQGIAGLPLTDALFMAALLLIGAALLLGIGLRLAAVSGALLMLMMWTAALPPTTNPVLDDHIVYAIVLVVLPLAGAGRRLGLAERWRALPLVQRYPGLE
ncbi:MAG TPA: hypothetical protein VGR28_05830 [Candidatus Thermoplasmatota archaeon]|jgi:thiosulfate dehydrogenase [quinone] large subunit|nr:hypothetical protein [Candidatus Thermoplasmatota archaeon]